MNRRLTGQYCVTTTGGEEVRAFIPFPLPPDPALDLSGRRGRLLENAILALGRPDSITLLLPDPDIFLYAYVRREALLSSQIKGTQSSFSDLLLFEIEEAPGKLLRTQNWIGSTRPGNAQFVPPPPDAVEDCMADLERFLNDEQLSYPSLVRVALAHVQFETIHPFLDGNGRIGRLLIAFVLHHEAVLEQPLLYLSLYFKRHRSEYYRLVDLVRMEGNWEAWLDFFLEGVVHTAQNAVETAQRLVMLFKEDAQKIQEAGQTANTALRVFSAFYVYGLLHRPGDQIRAGGSGGSVFSNLNKSRFSELKVLLANENCINAFHKVVKSAYRRILENQKESSLLANLRDTLLPRLISGELRVPDAERIIGRCI